MVLMLVKDALTSDKIIFSGCPIDYIAKRRK